MTDIVKACFSKAGDEEFSKFKLAYKAFSMKISTVTLML